jgi:hypothetical protein
MYLPQSPQNIELRRGSHITKENIEYKFKLTNFQANSIEINIKPLTIKRKKKNP